MSNLERAYVSTAEKTYKKVTGKDGNTYHFKDGTPVTEKSFNAGLAHRKFEGEYVSVAVPSDKGPGYERVEVNPTTEGSQVGQEIHLSNPDVPGKPKDTVTIDGEQYDTKELVELNERISDRHGSDSVFRYT